MSNIEDFEIQDGILLAYKGNDKEVVIPNGVTCIAKGAFGESDGVIVLPDNPICIGGGSCYVYTINKYWTAVTELFEDDDSVKYCEYNGARL